MLSGVPLCVTGDTFYACRALNYATQPYYTINCPSNTVINVQSAIMGYSGGSYAAPTDFNPSGACPWTAFTNNTCAFISRSNCSECQCSCVRPIAVPSDCFGQSGVCNFEKASLILSATDPLCAISRDADFLVVNYTCNPGQ